VAIVFTTLSDFYKSKLWLEFRALLIADRTREDGYVYDEITGKPIIKPYDIILHHTIELTLENVNDYTISLNPDLIQIVSFRTHNEIHNRFGTYTRHKYLVWGCPLSGKASFIQENAGVHDLTIDRDKIYACISNNPMYVKSGRLFENMQSVYNALLNDVKYRNGKWVNVFLVGGFPYKAERERLMNTYGMEEIYIPCTKEEALARLDAEPIGSRDKKEYEKHIHTWFERVQQ
jgi:hypothetical protein